MTGELGGLYDLIVGKGHRAYRRDVGLELAPSMAASGLSPVARAARRLEAVLAAERPVILEGERISFLRTVERIPEVYTEAEWAAIRGRSLVHERGAVCNVTPDYASTIALGLEARKAEARERSARCAKEDDAKGAEFLEAVIGGIDALLDLAERYRLEASRIGRGDIAEVLARVPRYGARTFREALQSFRAIHFALWCEGEYHLTIGRFDQYMLPYFEADLAAGRLDEAGAFDLLEEFFLSFNRDSDLYPGVQQGDNGQSLVLGGSRADGSDSFNLLSEMCLRASAELGLIDPKINLRVCASTPRRVFELGTELTKRGLGFPQYSNDEVVVPGLVALGYAPEDARDYAVAACWEFTSPGKGMDVPNIGSLSFPAAVDRCLRRELLAATGFESLVESAEREVEAECGRMAEAARGLWMVPAPLLSILFDGRIEAARDLSLGAKYNNYGFHGAGLSTAVDSLAALRRYVFEEGRVSAKDLLEALDADFAGREELAAELRYRGPKMGSGDEAVDALASRLLGAFARGLEGLRNDRGGRFRAGTGSAMFYLWQARELGATPDGRRAGEAFGANYSPSLFARVSGPLSVVRSFTAPDLSRTINGGPLTMEFHSSVFSGAEGAGKVADLVRLFVSRGGHQLQLNAVSLDLLKEAQAHPELHGRLVVRVWGWSAYFVELDKAYQDHVIARQEYEV